MEENENDQNKIKLILAILSFLMSACSAGISYPGGHSDTPAAHGSSGKKSVRRRSITLLEWRFYLFIRLKFQSAISLLRLEFTGTNKCK